VFGASVSLSLGEADELLNDILHPPTTDLTMSHDMEKTLNESPDTVKQAHADHTSLDEYFYFDLDLLNSQLEPTPTPTPPFGGSAPNDPLNLQGRALALLMGGGPLPHSATVVTPLVIPFVHSIAIEGITRPPINPWERKMRVERWKLKRRERQILRQTCPYQYDARKEIAKTRERAKGKFVTKERVSFHSWSELQAPGPFSSPHAQAI